MIIFLGKKMNMEKKFKDIDCQKSINIRFLKSKKI